MRYPLPFWLIILLCTTALVLPPKKVHAQRSVAELLSTIAPPKGDIEYRDGVRQIKSVGNYLFITNFWAGLQVADISDLRNPRQVAFVPSTDEAYYTDIEGNYAYMANHSSGIQVYDITEPAALRKVASVVPPGNAYWVMAEAPYLYLALGDEGFAIMDISDLNNPVTVRHEVMDDWVQQVFKKDNLLYLAAKKGGLIIYDIKNPQAPNKLSQFRTGYNTMMVQVVDNIAYLADGAGGMLTVNVENPAFPVLIKRFQGVGFVGNLHKVGSYVYLANRDVGLQIINITDPARPYLESIYETEDNCYGVFKKDINVFLAANNATLVMRHNNAPKLADIQDMDLSENIPFSLQLEASEPDGDPILFEVQNAPEGSSFDPEKGTFTWTPTYEQSGNYAGVVFQAIEQTETRLTASDTITLRVKHINRLPDLPTLSDAGVRENNQLTFTIPVGSDPDKEDQQRLAYRAEKLPEGAVFDPASRVFSWTPTYEQSGTYVLDFLIDDGGGGIDREPVTLTVEHVDRKPEIDPLTAQTVAEQQELSLKVSGTELDAEDQNRISFRMVNLPQGASFNASTQEFSWTPSYEQSGTFNNIMAIMQAGALSDTTIFAITVTHVNRAPSLVDIPAKFVDENAQISFVVDGSDPDKEDMGQLTFTASNLPEGATFTLTNRTFTWTPTYEQSGVYNTIEFSITDPQGLSDRKSVSITVNHVNRPPSIAEVPNQTTNENLPIAVQLSATDPDREDSGQLTFSANGLPEGATLDPQSGIFNWTPTYDQSGSYAITFSISDGEFTDSTPMTIAVTHVNRPPVLAQLSPQSVDENTGLTFTISGSDDDVEDAGKLVFSATKLPEGATFDPAARRFSWTPTFEQSGTYQVAFTVQDPSDLSNTQEVTITVNHVNRPPVLAAVPALTVDENTPLAFQLAGSDPDKEDAGKLSYEVNGIPENASVVPNSGAVSWTPTYDQSGAFALTAYVRDPAGLSAQQPVSIVVNNVNRPPKFGLATAQNGEESIPLSFTISASDPDGEDEGKLVYSAEGLPRGASIDRRTGAVTWTPDFEQSGDYQISLKVTDSFGETDQADVAISIAHVNRPPVLPIVGTQTFSENVAREVTLPAGSDPDQEDANRLTYRLDLLPAGATFNPATRVLAWTPTFEQAGSYQVNYVISDGSAEDVKNFSLEVANVNRPAKFAALPAQSAQENQAISFTVSAVDPDPEDSGKLTFSSGNLPQGASLDGSSGVFNWTPSFDQGGTYDINFTVRDGAGATDQTQVSIAVMEVNRAPELGQVSEISFQENQRASITLPAGSDADPKDRTSLSYRVDGLPAGASFDAMSRQLTWEPSFDQAGTYSVRYVVSDGSGESSVNVSITVVNVNRPPSVSVPGDQDIRVAQPLNFQISGSDPDPEDNGKLNYEVQGLPEGAIFDNRSGQFSWIPGPDQIGKFAVTFVVKDGSGMTGTAKVTINVSDATTAP